MIFVSSLCWIFGHVYATASRLDTHIKDNIFFLVIWVWTRLAFRFACGSLISISFLVVALVFIVFFFKTKHWCVPSTLKNMTEVKFCFYLCYISRSVQCPRNTIRTKAKKNKTYRWKTKIMGICIEVKNGWSGCVFSTQCFNLHAYVYHS